MSERDVMAVENALLSLIHALERLGVVQKAKLVSMLEGLGESLFVCEPGQRLDYREIARELERHPVLLECERRRAYSIRSGVSRILGREVKWARVGRRRMTLYLLWLPGQEETLPPCLRRRIEEGEKSAEGCL